MKNWDEILHRIENAEHIFDCEERHDGNEVGIFKDRAGYFGVSINALYENTNIYLSLSNAEVGDILLGNPFSPRSGLCAKYVIKAFENILESRR
jgi:hypothetical protein